TILNPVKPWVGTVLAGVGVSGILSGATMILSMMSDLLSLVTVHIWIFYSVAARLYHWQVEVLWSLFNLFRGRRRLGAKAAALLIPAQASDTTCCAIASTRATTT